MIYLGIDLGGTKIAAGLVDAKGSILESKSIQTDKKRGCDAIVRDIIKVSQELMYSFKLDEVKGVGIGVPGPVDVQNGIIINCVNLSWSNVPIEEMLRKGLNIPAFAANDATLAGIAEMEVGILRGVETGALFTLGTGVGGAVILNGQIQHGHHAIGSEFGHMIVGENYYDCNCGNNGCLETFCSATSLISYAKKLLKEGGRSPLMLKYAGNKVETINGIHIFNAAKEGDPLAVKVVERMVKYVAIGIINVASIIDPQVIAIGGGLSKAGDFLLNKIKTEVESRKYFKDLSIADIRFAALGNDAGIVGAAMLAKQRLET